MAASMPGDIKTEPNAKIVYNAPFTEKNVYNVRLTNNGAHRIGWAIKTTNMKRLAVEPAGRLPRQQGGPDAHHRLRALRLRQSEDTNNDRISFEWTNAPEGAAKQFRREWFQGDGMVRRKNLPIEYNP